MLQKKFINDRIKDAIAQYENYGGIFITPAEEIAKKIKNMKAFVFDWDGVFNDGKKGAEKTSDFSEVDSMGIHIFRYCYWRQFGELPIIAIITGAENESAIKFAERDHFDAVFSHFKDKTIALDAFKKEFGLEKNQIASMFDDIIDYPLAVGTGLRFFVNRNSSPLLKKYVLDNKIADYVTKNEQPNNPIREVCEMIVGFQGKYDETFITRFNEPENYQKFWNTRQAVVPKFIKK